MAYRADLSEDTGKVHSEVSERFCRGDAKVIAAMAY